MMEIGFASYTGPEFLLFYAALIVAALVASFWISGNTRPEGRRAEVHSSEDLALLAGGPNRFAESVLATLFAREDLQIGRKTITVARAAGKGATEAERAILSRESSFTMSTARSILKRHALERQEELASAGLLIARKDQFRLQSFPIAPFLLVLAIGLFRLLAGSAQGEPIGLLALLMLVAAGLTAWRFLAFVPRTRAGEDVLERAVAEKSRIAAAPTRAEAGLAVGLFGTAVLIGTPFVPLHTAKAQAMGGAGGTTGDSSSDGGDGGGGCGGGGCGGCGG